MSPRTDAARTPLPRGDPHAETDIFNCEAQGKGRARGAPRKVDQRPFIDGGWWMVDILSLMLYTKFGYITFPPQPPASLLISRIKLIMGQVR